MPEKQRPSESRMRENLMSGSMRGRAPRGCTGDGGRSPGAALQGEAPNHRRLRRLRAGVVSAAEKAHCMRQVRAEKANESEPPMKCRKELGRGQNRGKPLTSGKAWGRPAYCPGGVRHSGGANSVQALVRNVGTCRPDTEVGRGCPGRTLEGEPRRLKPKGESTDAGHGGRPPRSSGEAW